MALGPIQYLPQPKPFGLREGLAIGGTIRDIRERSAAEEQAELAREKAEASKRQYNTDLQAFFKNPTPTEAAKLTLKYPQQRDAFKQASSMVSEEQQQNELKVTGQVYTALNKGSIDVATNILDERIEARKNSGEDYSDLNQIRENIVRDPENAKAYAGIYL